MNYARSLSLLVVCALLGAGCPSKPVSPVGTTPSKPVAVAKSQGFGKLPSLGPVGQGQSNAVSAESVLAPTAAPAPMMAQKDATAVSGSAGVAAPSIGIVRPMPPIPYPQPRPVTVEYVIEGAMPQWGSDADVLKSKNALPDVSMASSLGTSFGLPSQLTSKMTALNGLNVTWKDVDNFQWTYDAGNRSLNAWINDQTPVQPPKEKPSWKNEDMVAAADRFLDAHGFSALRSPGGKVQDMPWAVPMMKGGVGIERSAMPCVYSTDAVSSGGGSTGASAGVATPSIAPNAPTAEPMMYPNPCGWWPQTVSVQYPLMRDGKHVVDAWGNEQFGALVTVRVDNGAVQGLNAMLDTPTEASRYPLIDQESAKRRLMSGGRNPVYPWGNEGKNIKVHLKELTLVWLRTDSWDGGANQSYWMPGLRATGTVDRGIKGQEPEIYQTVIPLLKDDAFSDAVVTESPPTITPPPLMMEGDVRK